MTPLSATDSNGRPIGMHYPAPHLSEGGPLSQCPFNTTCLLVWATAIKKQFADQIRSFKGHTSKKMTILADMMDFVNEKVGVPCRLQPPAAT